MAVSELFDLVER